MVMETPSPQCVGREFVRQYYTLMHECPKQLHRFYSDASSFVHGGVEKPGEEQPPYVGQEGIHAKIMSLQLNDCRAKIRQVDSQATVGEGVVVQVTGELSNNGEPMRRFMQTFVLALQSPKKYYVHNDIFRYQDEVFYDNDSDENQEDGVESEPEVIEPVVEEQKPVQDPNITSYYEPAEPAQPPLSNGDVHLIEQIPSPQPEEQMEKEPSEPDTEQYMQETTAEPEAQPVEQPAEPKTFSWAAMASKNAYSSSVAAPSPAAVTVKATPPPAPKDSPQPQRQPRNTRERTSISRVESDRPAGRTEEGGDFDGNRPPRPRFPDHQQLFVGNLTQDFTEKKLKTFFEEYGKVVDVRIHSKSGGGKVPNFGFVIFEDPSTVQKVMADKNRLRGDHQLNVEEKKARGEGGGGRPSSAPRQGRGGGSMERGSRGGPPLGERKRGGFGGNRPDAGRGGSGRGGGGGFGPRR